MKLLPKVAKTPSLGSSLTFVIEFINTTEITVFRKKQQLRGEKKTKQPSRFSPTRFCIGMRMFFTLLEFLSACCSLDRFDSN